MKRIKEGKVLLSLNANTAKLFYTSFPKPRDEGRYGSFISNDSRESLIRAMKNFEPQCLTINHFMLLGELSDCASYLGIIPELYGVKSIPLQDRSACDALGNVLFNMEIVSGKKPYLLTEPFDFRFGAQSNGKSLDVTDVPMDVHGFAKEILERHEDLLPRIINALKDPENIELKLPSVRVQSLKTEKGRLLKFQRFKDHLPISKKIRDNIIAEVLRSVSSEYKEIRERIDKLKPAKQKPSLSLSETRDYSKFYQSLLDTRQTLLEDYTEIPKSWMAMFKENMQVAEHELPRLEKEKESILDEIREIEKQHRKEIKHTKRWLGIEEYLTTDEIEGMLKRRFSSIPKQELDVYSEKYPDVFDGIGRLKEIGWYVPKLRRIEKRRSKFEIVLRQRQNIEKVHDLTNKERRVHGSIVDSKHPSEKEHEAVMKIKDEVQQVLKESFKLGLGNLELIQKQRRYYDLPTS